tara:strand:+ start:179 stop:862 length:684 start_codon:yes stop_codon:yes gene_type:complete
MATPLPPGTAQTTKYVYDSETYSCPDTPCCAWCLLYDDHRLVDGYAGCCDCCWGVCCCLPCVHYYAIRTYTKNADVQLCFNTVDLLCSCAGGEMPMLSAIARCASALCNCKARETMNERLALRAWQGRGMRCYDKGIGNFLCRLPCHECMLAYEIHLVMQKERLNHRVNKDVLQRRLTCKNSGCCLCVKLRTQREINGGKVGPGTAASLSPALQMVALPRPGAFQRL